MALQRGIFLAWGDRLFFIGDAKTQHMAMRRTPHGDAAQTGFIKTNNDQQDQISQNK
jgi:hypothetical protein